MSLCPHAALEHQQATVAGATATTPTPDLAAAQEH